MNRGDWMVSVIERDVLRRSVTVYIAQWMWDGKERVLCNDGTWAETPEGQMAPENAGLVLPREAWTAMEDHFAPKSRQGEIARLEEALALERARVDHALGRGD